MLTYEFDIKCQAYVALNEKRTPILFRKHHDRYEPAIFAIQADFCEESMTFHVRSVDGIIYWDYEDGMIKRDDLMAKQYQLPDSLPLNPEVLEQQQDEITFYSDLELLRLALDAGCVTKDMEKPYAAYVQAHGLEWYLVDSYWRED
ncbi:MAG: hypothetical protein MR332_00270 [Fusicatenibacter sp.]|nr:hypothetical protein [Fusicatenibacter sp.]